MAWVNMGAAARRRGGSGEGAEGGGIQRLLGRPKRVAVGRGVWTGQKGGENGDFLWPKRA